MTERHALVRALLDELPATNSVWPPSHRALWLQAAASVFDLVYGKSEAVIRISVPKPSADDMAKMKEALKNSSPGRALEIEPTVTATEPDTADEPESKIEDAAPAVGSGNMPAPERNVGGRPKTTGPARPAGIPTNLNMALDAIDHYKGKAAASQILAYVRRKYWEQAPSNWTASLYDHVTAKKLDRDGINFVRPIEPKVGEKPVASIAAAKLESQPAQVNRSTPDGTVKFEFNGKSAMLSLTEFRLAEALRRAMGKGHLDYAYLMQAGTAGQQRKAGLSEKVWCMEMVSAVRPLLEPLGLEITHSPDFGYSMRATAVD